MRTATLLLAFVCAPWQAAAAMNITACPPLKPRAAPSDVRQLKPVDIKVMGAMGDSITAGFAIDGSPKTVPNEAYSTGNKSNATTIVNFLKAYGLNIKEYNVAVVGDKVQGMNKQAENLINAIKGDKSIDFNNDWKMVTVWIGANNMCKSCSGDSKDQPAAYETDLTSALYMLKGALPRTIVNLVSMLHLESLVTAPGVNKACIGQHIITRFECPCAFGSADLVAKMNNVTDEDDAVLLKIAPTFASQDFAVVVQPALTEMSIPDWTYLSQYDCFHPSLLCHQQIATGLWKNLFEPVGKKTTKLVTPVKMYCPTDDDIIHSVPADEELIFA